MTSRLDGPTDADRKAALVAGIEKAKAERLEEALEAAYWEFDKNRRPRHDNGGGMSERDAFKCAVRQELQAFIRSAV